MGEANLLSRLHRHPSRHHMLTSQRTRAALNTSLDPGLSTSKVARDAHRWVSAKCNSGHPLQPSPLRAWLVNLQGVFESAARASCCVPRGRHQVT